MSLVVLACDPANLQVIADVAHCSQWVSVEHEMGFFDAYASADRQTQILWKQELFRILVTGFTFYFLWWATKRL